MRTRTSHKRKINSTHPTPPSDADPLVELTKELEKLFSRLGLSERVRIKVRVPRVKSPQQITKREPAHASLIGELLTHWHQDSRYLDDSGNPVPLPITGRSRSFRELARRAVPNIDPNYLLDELSNLGALKVRDDGKVLALLRSLPVYNDTELAALHTLRALRGFVRTLNHNLESGPSNLDQLFHRIAWNGELAAGQIPRLKIWLQRHGQNFLESADNWMKMNSRRPKVNTRRTAKRNQASIGIYLTLEDYKNADRT